MKKYTLEIVTVLVILSFAAIFSLQSANIVKIPLPSDGSAGGTDDRAADAIQGQGYQPWIEGLWQPSGPVTTNGFTIIAAAGSLVIGYFFGYYRGRQEKD